MAFAVQNDAGTTPNANAYVDVAFVRAYFADRNRTFTQSDAVMEGAIVQATDFLDTMFRYSGMPLDDAQPTEFPREHCKDRQGNDITGIPQLLKEACAEYTSRAVVAPLAPDPSLDASGMKVQSTSKTVGPISKSITYVAGGALQMPRYPAADAKLSRLGCVTSGVGNSLNGQTVRN